MSIAVSIILPTYNRARFLPQAIESICGQEFTDWELITVDDGSTDETAELLPRLTADITQPVRILRQENQGAYAARNTGLDHAGGKYIAFYDSDDLWLPHHLKDCVDALEANPDVDWVHTACRIVEEGSGRVVRESTFYEGDTPSQFMEYRARSSGNLNIIEDPGLAIGIFRGVGLYAGLQNSVIKKQLFAGFRFETSLRNEAEDQILVMLAALAKRRIGYIDEVSVVYRIHTGNSSGAAKGQTLPARRRLYEAVVQGFEQLPMRAQLTRREQRALKKLVSEQYFWHLGYAILWTMKEYDACFAAFKRAIRLRPLHFRYWKTYAACKIKVALRKWLPSRFRLETLNSNAD